eukprot:Tamp_21630.p3 GENE.Tamp_21630~~Tamp_21630.p3  ORF type:complete len:102 (+),score=7.68 Tamp_21630:12-317(+)
MEEVHRQGARRVSPPSWGLARVARAAGLLARKKARRAAVAGAGTRLQRRNQMQEPCLRPGGGGAWGPVPAAGAVRACAGAVGSDMQPPAGVSVRSGVRECR